jgi:arylsulfatase
VTAQFLGTFKEFPPRQRPASFNVDQYLEMLTRAASSTTQ